MSQVAVLMRAGLGSNASSTRCSLGVTPSSFRYRTSGGRPTQQKEMLTLDIRQHQRARNPVEHIGQGAPPRPCSSHVYQVGLMLARCATSSRTQPGRAPALRRKTERGWIELRATGLQISPEEIPGGDVLVHPVSHLYHDNVTTLPE